MPNLKNILMAKKHLIKSQTVLRETVKDPPILSYCKGRLFKDILVRAKLWRSTITPMDQWQSCLACLFYSSSNNIIFFWGTAEHSPSSITGSATYSSLVSKLLKKVIPKKILPTATVESRNMAAMLWQEMHPRFVKEVSHLFLAQFWKKRDQTITKVLNIGFCTEAKKN